jgi:signal transduction histidine kinase
LRNARRLQKLAENILDVTKIEANAVKLKKEAVDYLHSLISEVIEDFQHQIAADYSQVREQEEERKDEVGGQDLGLHSKKNVKIILSPSQSGASGKEQYRSYDSVINKSQENMVSSQTPPPLPALMIMVDRNRITQVLNNLISNALWSVTSGFSENNDRKVGSPVTEDENVRYIEVSIEKNVMHNNVIVSVLDNGRGINQDLFPKLFTKFVTKDDRGLGLGLYICKGIVEAHGGTIWAEKKQSRNMNSGAVFRFTLPLE